MFMRHSSVDVMAGTPNLRRNSLKLLIDHSMSGAVRDTVLSCVAWCGNTLSLARLVKR